MKVKSAKFIDESLINHVVKPDYTDVFFCDAPDGWSCSPDDVVVDFFTVMPGWVNALFRLRNVLVRPFGLKGSMFDAEALERAVRDGAQHRFMSVAAKSADETVLELADSHLDAYMSILFSGGRIHALTAVKYNNGLGRAYFFVIRPFHKAVVRSILKSSVRRLSRKPL